MSNQSLTTPAMFIVSADVFPINKNTAMLRAGGGGKVCLMRHPKSINVGKSTQPEAVRKLHKPNTSQRESVYKNVVKKT
jgi:hypothetical protein